MDPGVNTRQNHVPMCHLLVPIKLVRLLRAEAPQAGGLTMVRV